MPSESKASNEVSNQSTNGHLTEQDIFADFGFAPITSQDIDATMTDTSKHACTTVCHAHHYWTQTDSCRRESRSNSSAIDSSPCYSQQQPNRLHDPSHGAHHTFHTTQLHNPNPSPDPNSAILLNLTSLTHTTTHITTSLTALEAHIDAKLKTLSPSDPRRKELAGQFLQTAVLKMRGEIVQEVRRESGMDE